MPNRHYQGKERDTQEFIYVDLLPDMKRPRQFNVNIILIVLIAVGLSWLIIYMPLNTRQDELDEVLEAQNDLQSQYELTEQIIASYRLDADRIDFMRDIEAIDELQSHYYDHKQILDDTIRTVHSDGRILRFSYNSFQETYTLQVSYVREEEFEVLEEYLYDLDFVESASYDSVRVPEGPANVQARVIVEVDPDAE